MAEQDKLHRRGLMFILSSPSGAGKTTIARRLLAEEGADLRLSVSVTTRPIRIGEVEGRDYHFVDRAEFDRRIREEPDFAMNVMRLMARRLRATLAAAPPTAPQAFPVGVPKLSV